MNDPIVDEVRRVREELAKKHNYDVHAIFADLREKQEDSLQNQSSPAAR